MNPKNFNKEVKMFLIRSFSLLMLLFFASNCYGYDEGIFKIDKIEVSANTGDLVDSKTIALEQGTKEALVKLILTLGAADHIQKEKISSCLSNLLTFSNFVRDLTIKNERITSKSYSGEIEVTFDRAAVTNIMNRCGLNYADVSSGKTFFLPMIMDKGSYRAVDSELDPDLYEIASGLEDRFGLLHLKKSLITDELQKPLIDPNLIINGSHSDVVAMLQKQNCDGVIAPLLKKIGNKSFAIETRVIRKNEEYNDSKRYDIMENETQKQFFARVLLDVLKDVDLTWKKGVEVKNEAVFNSGVILEVSTPGDWNKVRAILNKMPIIKQYKFKSLDKDSIELELKYLDSPEALSKKLSENGLSVFKRNDKTIMKLTRTI